MKIAGRAMKIGDFISRRGKGRITKWHILESIVAGDAITKCGRRMTDEKGDLVSGFGFPRYDECKVCWHL